MPTSADALWSWLPTRIPYEAGSSCKLRCRSTRAGRIEEAKAFADGRMRVVLPVAEEGEVRLGIASMWLLFARCEGPYKP